MGYLVRLTAFLVIFYVTHNSVVLINIFKVLKFYDKFLNKSALRRTGKICHSHPSVL